MLAIGHMAAGFMIGNVVLKYTNNPVEASLVGFGVGLASHYVLDFIPHGHFSKKIELKLKLSTFLIFLDVFGGILFYSFIALKRFGMSPGMLVILISILGSILPDIKYTLARFIPVLRSSGILKWENSFHESTHWHGRGKKVLLLSFMDIWQIALVTVSLLLH